MKKLVLFFITAAGCLAIASVQAQTVGFGTSAIGTEQTDTIPRPPQVVSTYPSSVSDEVLLGSDTLSSSVSDIDINFGERPSVPRGERESSSKTPNDNHATFHAAILIELSSLRKEVAELREEVKGLRKKKKRRR